MKTFKSKNHLIIFIQVLSLIGTLFSQDFNVHTYGATGDGITLDTKAIQSAIDDCAKSGGRVLMPAGRYLSGTLFMRSSVTLHISEGATLLGSTKLSDYPRSKPAFRSYNDYFQEQALIRGENLENIVLEGRGTIDGQGKHFKMAGEKRPEKYRDRPHIIWFTTCRNVRVENLHLRNSARWMQHYLACDNVRIRGLTVYNHVNKNNDMIDIDSCKDVIISDCIGDTDDDGITIKSTSPRLAENITITNCIISSHCNAVKCGTESTGGFKNITISNIIVKPSRSKTKIYGSYEGTSGITLAVVDGGILDGVVINNVLIDGPRVPLYMRLGDRGRIYYDEMEKPPVGSFKNVTISNVIASGGFMYGSSITGLPNHSIENIHLNNIQITYKGGGYSDFDTTKVPELEKHYPEATMFGNLPSYGMFIRYVNGITMSNVRFLFENDDHRPALICDNVQGLNLNGFSAQAASGSPYLIGLKNVRDGLITSSMPLSTVPAFLSVTGAATQNILLIGNELSKAGKSVISTSEVNKESVRILPDSN